MCSPFFSRSFPTAPRSCPDSPVLAPFSSRSFQVYAKILPDSQPIVPRSIRSCHVLVPIEPRPIRLGPDCATFSPRLNQFSITSAPRLINTADSLCFSSVVLSFYRVVFLHFVKFQHISTYHASW